MSRNFYDHRIKELVIASRDSKMFEQAGVKASTARNWVQGRYKEPIRVDEAKLYDLAKVREIKKLKAELKRANALIELFLNVDKVAHTSLSKRKISCREKRKEILECIEVASVKAGKQSALKFIGVSISRYKRWRSASPSCLISQGDHCLRQYPGQVSRREILLMKEYVCSKKYAHMPISSLRHLAVRDKKIYCCADTWYKYKDRFGWKRPWEKVHLKRDSKRVLRATEPNEILHVDISQIKTSSGQKYYLQTIFDNYSRYVIAWKLHTRPSAVNTAELIRKALMKVKSHPNFPAIKKNFISERGTENLNQEVEKVFENSDYVHRLHKVHVRFSNNMLEVFFRALKNNYLNYLPARNKNELLRRLNFYIEEHRNRIPLNALDGATSSEKYFGFSDLPSEDELSEKRQKALKLRIEENRKEACKDCWEM